MRDGDLFCAEDQARLRLLVIVLALTAAYGAGYWAAYLVFRIVGVL